MSSEDILLMQPLLESSKTLLASYGLLDALQEQFDNDPDAPRFIQAAMIVYSVEQARAEKGLSFSNYLLSSGSTYAQEMPHWMFCLGEALGIATLADLMQRGIRQAIIDLGISGVAAEIGGFLAKHLGWWGAIAAVYTFTNCMTN